MGRVRRVFGRRDPSQQIAFNLWFFLGLAAGALIAAAGILNRFLLPPQLNTFVYTPISALGLCMLAVIALDIWAREAYRRLTENHGPGRLVMEGCLLVLLASAAAILVGWAIHSLLAMTALAERWVWLVVVLASIYCIWLAVAVGVRILAKFPKSVIPEDA